MDHPLELVDSPQASAQSLDPANSPTLTNPEGQDSTLPQTNDSRPILERPIPLNSENIPQNGNGALKAVYNAENFVNWRPKVYRQVANLLAEGWSVNKITKLCKVHHRTVVAVGKREREAIDERKKQIVTQLLSVASIGSSKMEEKIGRASFRDTTIGTGVAIDKVLAIQGLSPAVQVAVLNMPTAEDRQTQKDTQSKLDAIMRKLNGD